MLRWENLGCSCYTPREKEKLKLILSYIQNTEGLFQGEKVTIEKSFIQFLEESLSESQRLSF